MVCERTDLLSRYAGAMLERCRLESQIKEAQRDTERLSDEFDRADSAREFQIGMLEHKLRCATRDMRRLAFALVVFGAGYLVVVIHAVLTGGPWAIR
jgi:hypothetical protein